MSNFDAALDDGGKLAGCSGSRGGDSDVDGDDYSGLVDSGGDSSDSGEDYFGCDDMDLGRKKRSNKCDENCGYGGHARRIHCHNHRIHISNLPLDVTSDQLSKLFGRLGKVARLKKKRVHEDQWPLNIQINGDEHGNSKCDAFLSYIHPDYAHWAASKYNGYVMRGSKINVTMAEMTPSEGGYGSRRCGFRDRNRDSYGDYRERNNYGRDRNRDGRDGYGGYRGGYDSDRGGYDSDSYYGGRRHSRCPYYFCF